MKQFGIVGLIKHSEKTNVPGIASLFPVFIDENGNTAVDLFFQFGIAADASFAISVDDSKILSVLDISKDGKPQLTAQYQAEESFTAAPVLSGKKIVAVLGSRLLIFDLSSIDDGNIQPERIFQAYGQIQSAPVIHEGMIYFHDDEGYLYSLSL